MEEPSSDRSGLAVAFEWAATTMGIALQMVVPGLVGYGIDNWLGTRVVFLLLGFGLGAVLAGLSLARIAKRGATSRKRNERRTPRNDDEDRKKKQPPGAIAVWRPLPKQ